MSRPRYREYVPSLPSADARSLRGLPASWEEPCVESAVDALEMRARLAVASLRKLGRAREAAELSRRLALLERADDLHRHADSLETLAGLTRALALFAEPGARSPTKSACGCRRARPAETKRRGGTARRSERPQRCATEPSGSWRSHSPRFRAFATSSVDLALLVGGPYARAMHHGMFRKMGLGLGLLSGLVVGMMSGAFFWSALIGSIVGYVAGSVMDREEEKRAERTRHLDDVIGVTSGNLGADPESLRTVAPPSILDDLRADPEGWLTPPPPAVG
jgi:hypothetical protein